MCTGRGRISLYETIWRVARDSRGNGYVKELGDTYWLGTDLLLFCEMKKGVNQ